MRTHHIPASFAADESVVATGPTGQLAHGATFEHMTRLEERLYEVTDGVWCMVGNGLSNQTFVAAPDGLIVIDTGESTEEMAAALAAVRTHTDAPVAAVIYTHFHYCNGTAALGEDLPVWGHERIADNLRRNTVEVGPAAGRGLVHQFGMFLPPDGPDGLVGVGLGRFYKNPAHGLGTPGHRPVTHPVSGAVDVTIAGARVRLSPAPSDADDNVTVLFPDLGVCVNNHVWPALFNVFAIRGEEYRDPRILITGMEEILAFGPEHLVGAHGPPVSGAAEIASIVEDARDAVQYLWDQTVRGINKGLTADELTEFVQLPARFERTYFTQQHYGLVEHHVRQIHSGLRGWFDGDEPSLFPVPPDERARRLVAGFGGAEEVAAQARAALDGGDLRWALELASWLARADTDDPTLLAEVLRTIAQRTTSANIRNWCLTRVLELEGRLDLSRLRIHRFGRSQVLAGDPADFVAGLRVLLDPARAEAVDGHVRWVIVDGPTCGLRLRGQVAIPTDGADADDEIRLTHDALADLLGGRVTLDEALMQDRVELAGDPGRIRRILACFDVDAFR